MRLLHKLLQTSWHEKWLLFQSAILVLVIRISLHIVAFRRLQNILDRSARPSRVPETVRDGYVQDVVWAVSALARRTLGDRPCLVQALAARWLLGRAGIETQLRIGVTKGKQNDLLAHAWLDHKGNTIIGGRSSVYRYKVLEVLRPSSESSG